MENIEGIWKEYHDRLHGFIAGRIGDPSAADDILQEVFLRVHSSIDTLNDDSKLRSWLYRITRNSIVDYYRSHKSMGELPESLSDPEEKLTETQRNEIGRCLNPMFQSLPENYRQALEMAEVEGLTQKELAAREGLSLSGAKSRVQRGRSMMKKVLTDCCQFEFDRRGGVIGYERKGPSCACDKCDDSE